MRQLLSADNFGLFNPEAVVVLRCPRCRKNGTFESLAVQDMWIQDVNGDVEVVGERRCPDPACHALVFFTFPQESGPSALATFPAETIDFDATDLPASVVGALEEAVLCHANRCYKAAAMMIRKCLEELCHDRGAKGANLKERIKSLRDKVVIPEDLFDGLDDLRLLGNDAAHVESQDYDDVGAEEVEVGLLFTKEVLKSTYQYKGLREKLSALKKPAEDV